MRKERDFVRAALRRSAIVLLLAGSVGIAQEQAPPAWPDPVGHASETMPRAGSSLLLDSLATDSGRLIVVGERGHVLLSDDAGASWRQAAVPTRSTLTAVAAAGANVVAVGHDGVIVHSADAGDSWQRVREEPYSPDNQASPSNGAPLLDVLFLDGRRAIAIGAYSLMLASRDGGASWQPQPLKLDGDADGTADETVPDDAQPAEEDADGATAVLFTEDELMLDDETDPHLNAIARLAAGALVIVGERGTAYVSGDEGATWTRLSLPYDGSMFGALALPDGALLVYGLRGRVFESADGGRRWRNAESGTLASLFGGAVAADGTVLLVGNQGTILRRSAGAEAFEESIFISDDGETPALSGVQPVAGGKVLLVGERGVAIREARP